MSRCTRWESDVCCRRTAR